MKEVDKNEFFRKGTLLICGSLDIRTVVERCYDFLSQFIPVDDVSFSYYDQAQNMLRFIATKITRLPHLEPSVLLPPDQKGMWEQFWVEPDDVEIINHPDKRPVLRKLSEISGFDLTASRILLRLRLEGKQIGIFAVRVSGNGRYSREHADLVSILHSPLSIAMANAIKHLELERLKDMLGESNQFLQRRLRELSGTEIIGAEFGLDAVMRMVGKVAQLDSPVLLRGETGVGKGLIAAAIHKSSPRRDGPFIDVNCGAIPDTLLDSELFGHEKGAFTGAIERKKGRFERANTGTIFLDEIGELPPQAQVRLLNVIQNREIERVGGTRSLPVDIRIISATHRNLDEMVKNGEFREDLWYRLNVFPITIPPLRQRKGDIPALVQHFIEKKTVDLKKIDIPGLDPDALENLMAYDWPGNIRELQNIVERALILHTRGTLRFTNLLRNGNESPETVQAEPSSAPFPSLEEMNRTHIRRAISRSKGKISGPDGAADILQVKPSSLRRKMDKLGIPYRKKDVVVGKIG